MRYIAKKIAENTNNSENDVFSLIEDEEYIDALISRYWFLTEEIKNPTIEETFGALAKAIDASDENPLAHLQAILDIEDNAFEVLKETLLAEFEKNFNDPSIRILIMQQIMKK